MEELTKAQRSRIAIKAFQTTADALALRGYYKPSGRSGQTLTNALQAISPEIYGSMNDSRIIELKGLEYVMDRLPRGIEASTRIVLTAQEVLGHTSFEKIMPLKRRRTSYCVSDTEICFVITRGLSEIYDILTHLTFLNIEAGKIRRQMHTKEGQMRSEWLNLEATVKTERDIQGDDHGDQLDKAIWNLSMILGRTYQETRHTYEYLEESRRRNGSNSGLFNIVYRLGQRVAAEEGNRDAMLQVHFTPSLNDLIGHQKYGKKWAAQIKRLLVKQKLVDRPLHIISANLHSVLNLLYAYGALSKDTDQCQAMPPPVDIYDYIKGLKTQDTEIKTFAYEHGLFEIVDRSGAQIDVQVIDTAQLAEVACHPQIMVDWDRIRDTQPVIVVMDYAFGAQAFELMDELLNPIRVDDGNFAQKVRSISVMGKAGILPGQKGDIILARAHVLEGTAHNYRVDNDLGDGDFDADVQVYCGPIVTVLGTSLQNRDVLERFQSTSWKAVGLEMEGGHYQRAISGAIIRGHIPTDVKVRYAYYASDNPLVSGQTLASGSMGPEGIKPTYMITKVILEKILGPGAAPAKAVDHPNTEKM